MPTQKFGFIEWLARPPCSKYRTFFHFSRLGMRDANPAAATVTAEQPWHSDTEEPFRDYYSDMHQHMLAIHFPARRWLRHRWYQPWCWHFRQHLWDFRPYVAAPTPIRGGSPLRFPVVHAGRGPCLHHTRRCSAISVLMSTNRTLGRGCRGEYLALPCVAVGIFVQLGVLLLGYWSQGAGFAWCGNQQNRSKVE